MTPQQIQHVQTSFELVLPIAETAATLFYGRLFEIDPSTRPLFKGDMKAQGRMLMQTLAVAVRSLHEPEKIIGGVQALGRRHVGYGVNDAHYDSVGAALLWTLDQGLGAAFTPDVREAWTQTYGLLAGVMKEAARAPLSAAA